MKATLRKKKISGKRVSLYLDFYPPIPHPETGEPTRREFLGRWIYEKPKNALEREHNNETRKWAESRRRNRENELNKPEIYSLLEQELRTKKKSLNDDFLAYFRAHADKYSGKTKSLYYCCLCYLEKFTNGKVKFSDLNLKFCNDFREFLLTTKAHRDEKKTLTQNAASMYFSKFKAVLRQAFKDDKLNTELSLKIDSIKLNNTHREFLTTDELNDLIKTDCRTPVLKRAALFSALTGLRFSDIQKLTWEEVHENPQLGDYLKFTQQKTQKAEVLPISTSARDLMGERKEPSEKVFHGFIKSMIDRRYLRKWLELAGIERKITFHCFRHTFATLQLAAGTDIYTISKMIGHSNISTTQIYAKVLDTKKREAANKIKLAF